MEIPRLHGAHGIPSRQIGCRGQRTERPRVRSAISADKVRDVIKEN